MRQKSDKLTSLVIFYLFTKDIKFFEYEQTKENMVVRKLNIAALIKIGGILLVFQIKDREIYYHTNLNILHHAKIFEQKIS